MQKIFGIVGLLLLLAFPLQAADQYQGRESQLADVLKAENAHKNSDALKLVGPVVQRSPRDEFVQIVHGRLLVKTGSLKNAIEVLSPLAREHSDDWQAWFWLGSAYLMTGDLDSASYYLEEALAREGKVASIWVQRAIVEQERNNSASAVSLLQVANSIEPKNPDIILNLAYANELAGNKKQAIEAYQYFLNLAATSPRHGRIRSQVSLRLTRL